MWRRFGSVWPIAALAITVAACGTNGPAAPSGAGGAAGASAGRGGAGGDGGRAGGDAGGGGGAAAGGGGGTGGGSAGAGATSGGAGGGGGNAAGEGGASGAGGATAGSGGATAGAGSGGAAGGGGLGGSSGGTGASSGGAGGSSGGNSGGGTGGGGTGGGGAGGSAGPACGNGVMDPGETCDDRNRNLGDGCGYLCQTEADWQCATPGSPCVLTAVCGDGVLASREACDDGNTMGTDGCAADCRSIDPSWTCPVPGRRCVPLCGNGVITSVEQCDDGNTTPGDGCSPSCRVEPGATCTGQPSSCTLAVCGNGVRDAFESCDTGALNGFFYGDASGCAKTCTREPSCRSGATTRACDVTCGNGNVESGEACDDGNRKPGDGCSETCTVEAGFTCALQPRADTQTCENGTGQCVRLPAVLRDFKNERVSGGHPDFFYIGAPVSPAPAIGGVQGQASPFSYDKRYCVPDAAGPAKRGDTVNRAWDLAADKLGANGKPTFNAARTNGTLADCQFIDWSDDSNGGHVPGYTATSSPLLSLAYVDGAFGHKMYRGLAPIVTSAQRFAEWFVDSAYTDNVHTTKLLELAPAGGNRYLIASLPHTPHGGFFPLDPPGQFPAAGSSNGPGATRTVGAETLQCNLWPYWFSTPTFGAGANCRGDQYLFPPAIDGTLYPNGTWLSNVQGWFHNFWFTTEIRTTFLYTGAFTMDFAATDDFFVFINGMLVVDLGGTHQRLPAHVAVSGTGVANVIEGGRLTTTAGVAPACPSADPYTGLTSNAMTNEDGHGHANCTTATCDCRSRFVALGLELGRTYEIAIFAANRHSPEYNLNIGWDAPTSNVSACTPRCGDGVQNGGEQCDCGDVTPASDPACAGMANNNSTYGGCTTSCTLGPRCGDGVVNGAEQCDLGARDNTGGYGTGGCTPGCRTPRRCGDGFLDQTAGEQCDLGAAVNGTAGASCSVICAIAPDAP